MKGFMALVLMALLGLSAYNWVQINALKQDIARLDNYFREQQTSSGITDRAVAEAVRALARAREALSGANIDTARAAFDSARQKLAEAARTASQKTAPTVKWLEGQASELGRQMQERFGSGR